MLSLIKRHKLGLTLLLVGIAGMIFLAVKPASANHMGCSPVYYNRCAQHGYFTGQQYNTGGEGTFVMSTGSRAAGAVSGMPVSDVNNFVCRIYALLYDGTPPNRCPPISTPNKYQDTTGAAFIINTMLGRHGTDYSGSRDVGVVSARNSFGEWEKRVRWYDSQGLVGWNDVWHYHPNFENSLFDRVSGDNAYYLEPEPEDRHTITFYAPGRTFRHFLIKKNCGNPIGSNAFLRPVPEPMTTIQGIKVPNTESAVSNAPITYVEGGGPVPNGTTTNANPYSFTVHHAEHRINANSTPAGWRLIGYTLCINSTGCHGNTPTPSNTAYVDLRGGGYADLWWHYERLAPPPPDITAQCMNGTVTAQVRWNTGVRPATRYVVDIDDANNFNQFWNKDVPQGSSSTNAPEGFRPYPSSSPALTLRRGQQYFVRIYYVNSNEHSQVRNFTAPTCWQFTIPRPTASAELKPASDDPQNVDLAAGFTINYLSPVPPNPQGVKLRVTRTYYIKKANGGPNQILRPNPSPNPDDRWFNGADRNGRNYLENRNIPADFSLGDQVCVTITVSPGSGSVDTNGNVTSPGPAVTSDEGCAKLIAKPYFRVYGGDVSAGSAACTGWSASSPGLIAAYAYNDAANIGRGSGAQLAAFAVGAINGFSSANGRTVTPLPVKGLTFANIAASGAWGGNFGPGFCAYDYFGTRPATEGMVGTDLSGKDGDYNAPDGVHIGGQIDANGQVTLYVAGNVIIDRNITYALPATGWPLEEVPNFTLVAQGNIYIGANVTEISGLFVAQPLSLGSPTTGGEIYTCAFGTNIPTQGQMTSATGSPGVNNCRNPLTVKGSFAARRVHLFRTHGSLKDSCTAEQRNPVAPCSGSRMAERFIFGPENWFSTSINPIGGDETYDSITTLPPVL